MSLEKRIRDELSDTAERLALDPGEYRRAMERGATRRRQRLALFATSGVGLVALVLAINALETGTDPNIAGSLTTAIPATTLAVVPPVTTANTGTTTPALFEIGESVAATSADGLAIFEPQRDPVLLTSDPYYKTISWVISDGDGGIVYTHEITPLPWEQGTLLRLPAGAINPQVLVAPEGGGLITPLGVEDGSVFYRLDDLAGESSIRAIGLDGSDSRVVVGPMPLLAAAAVDDGLLVVARGGDCGAYELYTTDGAALPVPAWAAECGAGAQSDIALADGFLFTLSDIESQRQLVRIDLETGEQASTPIQNGWQVEALSASRVAFTSDVITVGDFSGDEFVETESFLGGDGTFALLPGAIVATNARLGSGMGELPCTPLDVPNPEPPGLPAAVEEKFQQVFSLAKNCELEALAEIARNDGTAITFGGAEDPVQTWVGSARRGFDVLAMTVRILNAAPAREGDIYAWPAVFVTNSEEDWQQLSGILSAAEFDQMYQYRSDFGYLGLRVGIDPNGLLVYLIAGD